MSDMKDFVIANGVLKRYIGAELSVTIPDGVKKIERFAFSDRTVKEIIIPSTVKDIKMLAFPEGTTICAAVGSTGEKYAKKYSHIYQFVAIGTSIVKNASTIESKGKVSPLRAMAILEDAILDCNVQKVSRIIEEYKTFELPSRALGLACRTGQLDIVKLLVKNKFNFTYKKTDKTLNSKYALYYKPSSYKYHADFSLLMVVNDVWDRYLFGYMEKSFPPADLLIKWVNNTERNVSAIPHSMILGRSQDRAEVIQFLYSKKKISDVKCNSLLYYAILENDIEIIETLASLGAVVDVAWLDPSKYDASYVPEYRRFIETIVQKPKDIQHNIFANLNRFMKKSGCKLNLRENLLTALDCSHNVNLTKIILENADTANINKTKYIKSIIEPTVNSNAVIEFLKADFSTPRVLDDLIELASVAQHTELKMAIVNYKNEMVPEEQKRKLEAEGLVIPSDTELLKKQFSTEKLSDGTLSITNYKGDGTDIIIPTKIGKATVSSIGEYAFSPQKDKRSFESAKKCGAICSVTIPNNINIIEGYAFSSCSNLVSVILPECNVKIGVSAFSYCQSLVSIVIPQGCKNIARSTFYHCEKLDSVTIPESVTKIDALAFEGCTSLTAIVIPDSVKTIGDSAFYGCEKLQTISLSNKVKIIANNAFCRCENLTIHAPAGSYAEQYAKENNIPFVAE